MARLSINGMPNRRKLLQGFFGAAAMPWPARARSAARAIVVGGGFGGASCARVLHRAGLAVTLVELNAVYTACPMSNGVLTGLRDLSAQEYGYGALQAEGIAVIAQAATAVDPGARTVHLADGSRLPYDRLVLAPGVDFRFDAIAGYSEAAAQTMPHAWKAGAQTSLLRKQLEAMEDGGLFVIAVPTAPYRCPPAPYERASLVAHWFKTRKPRSKVLILDSKDVFSQQKAFTAAWSELYPGLVEWVGLSNGGAVVSVDAAAMTVETDFDSHKATVANIIPPQRAGDIARIAGVADRTGWCPVRPLTFESTLVPGIHIIGDAAFTGVVPKSAVSANAEAKACALAIAAVLAGREPQVQELANACSTLIAPDRAIAIRGLFRAAGDDFAGAETAGSGQVQAADDGWYGTLVQDVFG